MSSPPAVIERVFRRIFHRSGQADTIAGDLREEYADIAKTRSRISANAWYYKQLSLIAFGLSMGILADLLGRGIRLDIRSALRGLVKSPAYSIVALLSLVVGLGSTTSVFSIVNPVLIRPLPYPEPDRLVDIGEFHPVHVCEGCGFGASAAAFATWKNQATLLEQVEASTDSEIGLTLGDTRREIRVASVTPGMLPMLGFEPEIGSGIPVEGALILTNPAWQRLTGSDSAIVGQAIPTSEGSLLVTGVLQEGARFVAPVDAYRLLSETELTRAIGGRDLWVIARLSAESDIAALNSQLSGLSRGLAETDPAFFKGWVGLAQPLRSSLLNEVGDPTLAALLLLASFLVLLIASANLAAVTTARFVERAHEMGVRIAVGASKWRLLRSVLMESVMLATIGCIGAILLAGVATDFFGSWLGPVVAPWLAFEVDWRVVVTGVGLAGSAILMSAVIPAVRAINSDPVKKLKSGSTQERPSTLLYSSLTTAQIALGLVLVSTAVLSVRSFMRVSDFTNLGYRPHGVSVASIELPDSMSEPAPRSVAAAEIMGSIAAASPGSGIAIEAARFIGTFGGPTSPSLLRLEGMQEAISNRTVPRHAMSVSPGYFNLLEIPMLQGRDFNSDDAPGGSGVVIVNERAAQLLWPGESPLGKALRVEDELDAGWLTVVGVVGTTVISPLQGSRRGHPRIYTAYNQSPASRFGVLMRWQGVPLNASELAAAVQPHLPDSDPPTVSTLLFFLHRWTTGERVLAMVVASLAGLAILMSVIGVYGTASMRVSSQLREIGIRLALGATKTRIAGGVAATTARVLVIGSTIGLIFSIAGARVGEAGGFNLGSSSPVILAASALVAGLVVAAATLLPAVRAAQTDPVSVLRNE